MEGMTVEAPTMQDPLRLEPVGQCPYCHHNLERRFIHQRNEGPIFTFWGCTNRRCCLMFWRMPPQDPRH